MSTQITSAGVEHSSESGFTLIEATIALVVLFVALMGVFTTFTLAIVYNTGNSKRSQALSVLQQEVEQVRASKFTPQITDPILLGGTKADRTVTSADGTSFTVSMKVDDDPFTALVQTDNTKTLKEITITVTPVGAEGWVTGIPARVIMRRTRAN
jgi:type II secretory pathway pseudopilin PulG